ncbi:hypothetical protein ACS0TY_018521 [Phlomoides rotata]
MAAPSPTLSKHSQDETLFNYNTFSENTSTSNEPGLIYQGGTYVPQGSTFLRLIETDTFDKPTGNSVGRVVYSEPIKFWESSPTARQVSFETIIKFKITPSGNGAADGLAFFIAPVNTTIPIDSTTGGNLGIFGPKGTTPNLFAVEFDTFINDWDPKDRHIGIDIGSRKSVSTESFESGTGELVTAHINYNSKTSTISVGATSGQHKASLSCVNDLKNLLPQQVQVGISSAGGDPVTDSIPIEEQMEIETAIPLSFSDFPDDCSLFI